ncbi:hypothetical protein C9426_21375 [Serratia sp. S1B]|nr:hypothetical protein C9426_21375 [Serratia sp. S1B]
MVYGKLTATPPSEHDLIPKFELENDAQRGGAFIADCLMVIGFWILFYRFGWSKKSRAFFAAGAKLNDAEKSEGHVTTSWTPWRIVMTSLGVCFVCGALLSLGLYFKSPPTDPLLDMPSSVRTQPVPLDKRSALQDKDYQSALIRAIQIHLIIADDTSPLPCKVAITQLPGGHISKIDFAPDCPYSRGAKQAILEAIQKSDPLPYQGFEQLFKPTIDIIFKLQPPNTNATSPTPASK